MNRSPSFARLTMYLAAAVVACLYLLPPAIAQQPAAQTYMLPMRDGVRLATDVHLGAGDGPWPVILVRTPYSRKGVRRDGWENYAVVGQDTRGRFDSQGEARAFFDDGWGEHQDGLDTVKWVLAQPWCNGKIGTMGYSALGITQVMLAGANPPGVVCQHIGVAVGSMYHHAAYPGGVFHENLQAGWLEKQHYPAENLKLMLAHPFYDDQWKVVDAIERIPALHVDIPAVHIGGWFDIFTQGTIDSFVTRSRVAADQWMVIGPWPHGFRREVGELVFPENAGKVPAPAADPKLWFDSWLRGEDNGVQTIPHVQYYVMGACGEEGAPGNQWRAAEAWPPPARLTRFFLASDGQLLRQAESGESTLSYDYDPAKPVPTRGGGNLLIAAGPMDQRELEKRADVLVFSTPELDAPVEVTGRMTARIHASSSARDTVFTAELCDVYPDGRSMLLADGALRAACRESFSNPAPIEPGRIYEFNIDIGSTSIIFNRGHRIRVAISSSNYPRYAAFPNVWDEGEPSPQQAQAGQVAHQRVYLGGAHPSAVILPVASRQ